MVRLRLQFIKPCQLKAARECAVKQIGEEFLMFDERSRCYQLLFNRTEFPDDLSPAGVKRELQNGGCCGEPSKTLQTD